MNEFLGNGFFYISELYEKEVGGKKLIYWHVKFPFPMSNRDVSSENW